MSNTTHASFKKEWPDGWCACHAVDIGDIEWNIHRFHPTVHKGRANCERNPRRPDAWTLSERGVKPHQKRNEKTRQQRAKMTMMTASHLVRKKSNGPQVRGKRLRGPESEGSEQGVNTSSSLPAPRLNTGSYQGSIDQCRRSIRFVTAGTQNGDQWWAG